MYFMFRTYAQRGVYRRRMMSNTPLKIIAVGNSFFGDDGIGEAVLHALRDIPEMKDIPLIDAATDAIGLIDHFTNTDHVILIDAAQMGANPGTVKVMNEAKARLAIQQDHISLHGISIADTIELARKIDSLPKKITIIGVEPEQLIINTGLSKYVQKAVPIVISNILTLYNNQFL